MKYFLTEAERRGTLYFEFRKGSLDDKFWCEDSLYLHADVFDELKMYELFSRAVPHFAYYGETEVTIQDWQILQSLAQECGGDREAVIAELAPWAEDCFVTENVFTICGI